VKTDTQKDISGVWQEAISDAEIMLKAALKRVEDLQLALDIFRAKAERGEAWPVGQSYSQSNEPATQC
jgi:hypothetical protein